MRGRIISFCLICLLLCSSIALSAVALSGSITLDVGFDECAVGKIVSIPITINSNSGFVSMSLSITYDTSALTLISCEYTDVISGSIHSANYSSPYKLTWENDILTSNITATGTIAYLTFLVSEDAKEQEYSIIVRTPTDGVLDANGNTVAVTFEQGTIKVTKKHICHFEIWEYVNRTTHVRYCKDCDEKEYKNHNWNDGIITKQPDHKNEGEISYTCLGCNYTYTNEIDPKPHDWGDLTQFSKTQHKRTCSCGEIEYTNHSYINHKCVCGAIEYMSVSFMNGDAQYFKGEVKYNSALDITALTALSTKKGYVFVGWYTEDGTRIENGMTITESMVVYAKFVAGDADGNGKIEKKDAENILKYIVGQNVPVNDATALDVNRDGKVTVVDVITLLLYLAGKIELIN